MKDYPAVGARVVGQPCAVCDGILWIVEEVNRVGRPVAVRCLCGKSFWGFGYAWAWNNFVKR